MKKKFKQMLIRFSFIVAITLLVCISILSRAMQTIFVERDAWQAKAEALQSEENSVSPVRGNIYSCDGELMASSLPRYKLYMDLCAGGLTKERLMRDIVPLSEALSQKFGNKTAQRYRDDIEAQYELAQQGKRPRNYMIYPTAVSYSDLKEIKQFPLFVQGANRSGFHVEEVMNRVKPFGGLASRIIGSTYGDIAKGGKNGIELSFDAQLRGTSGRSVRQKVGRTWIDVTTVEPQNGIDIRSTIDLQTQAIVESALKEKLIAVDAEGGCAVVMETATGRVKAISAFSRSGKGNYLIDYNRAIADELEPGSTFKLASMIVALENGIIHAEDTIDTGNGVYHYGRPIRDHNFHRGGYGKITAAQTMWYSSNVGTAKYILKGYENNPSAYVDALYKMGLNTAVDLGISGAAVPHIPHPKESKERWPMTTLPWMSYGYGVTIPPIYTLMFYNAVANGGTMVKPLFVQEILEDSKIIKEIPTEVVVPRICSDKTLSVVQQMLVDVVEKGTASAVHSDYVQVAGKTGTAQISNGGKGYSLGGVVKHRVSFCGYFPAERPQYSCIVVIYAPNIGYPSGGTMSGGVVREIAEQTIARHTTRSLATLPQDTLHRVPEVRNGRFDFTKQVLNALHIDYNTSDGADSAPWTTTLTRGGKLLLQKRAIQEKHLPNVVGMGARDALYLLEEYGLVVQLQGYGRVESQSLAPGRVVPKGATIRLQLKP